MQKRISTLRKRYMEPTHVALELPERPAIAAGVSAFQTARITCQANYTEGATNHPQEVAMAATLITALALIALVACAALIVRILRERNPMLLQQQEQSVRTWFDHMIHRH